MQYIFLISFMRALERPATQLSRSFAIGDIAYGITASPIRGQAEARRRHLTRGNCDAQGRPGGQRACVQHTDTSAAQVVGKCDLDYNLFLGIQFIPVNQTNPPVTTQLKWDSPQVQALARRACMDCHSNETRGYDLAPPTLIARKPASCYWLSHLCGDERITLGRKVE